jgi:hypothetical protein
MEPELTAVFEELTRQFIAAEIRIGLTFARMAAREYAEGNRDQGHKVRAHAREAYAEAERRLQEGDARGWEMGVLREQLRGFCETLDELPVRRASAKATAPRQRPRSP